MAISTLHPATDTADNALAPLAGKSVTEPATPDMSLAALTSDAYREWLFPGADDLFRGIYAHACSGDREVLAVCSAIAGEGKTTVSLGLGVTLAEDHLQKRVLVVETDLQRPVLAADFQFPPSPGLTECLLHDVPLEHAYRSTFLENLTLLPAGGPVERAGKLLHSQRLVAAIAHMREAFDVVILDVPAVLSASASTGVANQSDGILFVIRSGVTPATLVGQAMKRFDPERLRGVVLNENHSRIPNWLRRIFEL